MLPAWKTSSVKNEWNSFKEISLIEIRWVNLIPNTLILESPYSITIITLIVKIVINPLYFSIYATLHLKANIPHVNHIIFGITFSLFQMQINCNFHSRWHIWDTFGLDNLSQHSAVMSSSGGNYLRRIFSPKLIVFLIQIIRMRNFQFYSTVHFLEKKLNECWLHQCYKTLLSYLRRTFTFSLLNFWHRR